VTAPRLIPLLPALLLTTTPAFGQKLVADLSNHLIGITTGFDGADVVLFGAVEGPGEVRVVVTGPPENLVVRRKRRIAGIWVNAEGVSFPRVPGFHAVAASGLNRSATDPAPRGGPPVPPRLDPSRPMAEGEVAPFRDALVRRERARGVYAGETTPVTFLGERLFRADIRFPANVPIGLYGVQVSLVRDGETVGAQTTPLVVTKVGVSAEISAFARAHPFWYGLVALIGAVLAGWGGAFLMRRV